MFETLTLWMVGSAGALLQHDSTFDHFRTLPRLKTLGSDLKWMVHLRGCQTLSLGFASGVGHRPVFHKPFA